MVNAFQLFSHSDDYASEGGISVFNMAVIFLLMAFTVLYVNEKKHLIALQRMRSAEDSCQTTSSIDVNPNLNMQLVHMIGQTTTNALVIDPLFNIQVANAIKIERQVQILINENVNEGAIDWKPLFIRYGTVWPVEDKEFINPSVQFGSYILTEIHKQQLRPKIPVQFELDNLEYFKQNSNTEWKNVYVFILCRFEQEGFLYLQQDEILRINNYRIRLLKEPCGIFTVIAQQFNNTFQPYKIQDQYQRLLAQEPQQDDFGSQVTVGPPPIDEIFWIFEGSLSKSEAFEYKLTEERKSIYQARFYGWLIIFFALSLMIISISIEDDDSRLIFGPIYSSLSFVLQVLVIIQVSISLTLLVIAFVWLLYRPIIGFILCLIGIGSFSMLGYFLIHD